jgi:antitoxin component YwqK of YwqJK toxin-antitoxin module
MKKIALLLLSSWIFLFQHVFAQRQNTYFLKNNGDYVSKADSADIIRIVQEPENGSTLYPIKEFYVDGSKKSYGYSSKIDPPLYEGQFISFFKNGIRKQFANYVQGKTVDTVYNYFPNGKLYSALYYTQRGDSSVVQVVSVKDSAGSILATNGNGKAVFYDEDFKYITETGDVKNGKHDGDWVGELRATDTLRYKEVYADGKMLSGESTDGKGNVYHYTASELKPQFKGGIQAFYRQIARGVRYPPNLVSQRIEGVAYIKFVIFANGEINDVHAVNKVHPALASEAIRMVKAIKGWQPGIQKGRIVNVSYVVPISFALSR